MGWRMLLGSAWMVFFWAVVIWAVVRITSKSDASRDDKYSALDIAKRRYAAGDLSKDDFERLRTDLLA